MKKLILSLFSVISFTAFAQSLSVEPAEYYYSEAGETCTAHFDVTNISDQSVSVMVTRTMNPNDAITSTFCWGETCYIPTVDVSAEPIVIGAGESSGDFSGYIYAMPTESSFVINYCFSVENDPSDKTCVDVTYTSLTEHVGVEENTVDFAVYPNPANEMLYLDYNSSDVAEFVLYDMLGNTVYRDALVASKTVNLNAFEAGIYFYSFSVEGKKAEVQKLIITH